MKPKYTCADCQERPATMFLPEGRYLCHPCWKALKNLRLAVVAWATRKETPR